MHVRFTLLWCACVSPNPKFDHCQTLLLCSHEARAARRLVIKRTADASDCRSFRFRFPASENNCHGARTDENATREFVLARTPKRRTENYAHSQEIV
jgi:hypothetical protein